MKRLRRFNEDKTDMDYDYVYQCFAELLDDNKAEIIHKKSEFGNSEIFTVYLKIKKRPDERYCKERKTIQNSNFFDFVDAEKYNSEILQESEIAIRRIYDEYPHYQINFELYTSVIYINIFPNKEKKEDCPF